MRSIGDPLQQLRAIRIRSGQRDTRRMELLAMLTDHPDDPITVKFVEMRQAELLTEIDTDLALSLQIREDHYHGQGH